ncbi:hypothetical protein RHSP_57591 [Rhizobium freirei PRF 81]|uniref:Transmembrane protein n=1 Tax=Rhizobium freirei PRF 81 TaxID=363754 RepID=N6U434_9HYPH|nr:hypothetical protein [Rhizobium freirei]ENN85043.1 hypothetical protein RHSP_57591 [Rhizobium freirei PRF 81]
MIDIVRIACLILAIIGIGGGWRRIIATNVQAAGNPAFKNDKAARRAFIREKMKATWRLLLIGWIGIALLISTFFIAR